MLFNFARNYYQGWPISVHCFDRFQDFDSIVWSRDIRYSIRSPEVYVNLSGCRATISQSNGYIIVPQDRGGGRCLDLR